MAGPVLLRPDAFNRCKLIAAEVGMKHGAAIGAMSLIWQESQTLRIVEATKRQLALWGELDADIVDLFIGTAVTEDVHFFEELESGRFKIVGNDYEVERVETLSATNRDKAKIRWTKQRDRARKKLHAAGMPPASRQHAAAMPETCRSDALDLDQCKNKTASHVNTSGADAPDPSPLLQRAGIRRLDPAVDTSTPPDIKGGDVWKAYEAAYYSAYRVLPVRNARSNALCKQLITRLGGDGAIGVVKFFVSHRKDYYTAVCHDLAACVKDAEALHTQMRNGSRVTSTVARMGDRSMSNVESAKGAVELLRNGNGDPFDLGR